MSTGIPMRHLDKNRIAHSNGEKNVVTETIVLELPSIYKIDFNKVKELCSKLLPVIFKRHNKEKGMSKRN